jgi:DNA-binding NarL/FixJ family response regulator
MTTIFIAEDDALLQEMLADALEDHEELSVLGSAGNGRSALEETAKQKPDVLLLDLNLPDLSGLQVLAELQAAEYTPQVLVLSGEESEEVQLTAAKNGARGFLPKTGALSALPATIGKVASGELCFSPRVVQRILKDYAALARRVEEQDSPLSRLTPREREVLVAVARGLTNGQIGRELYMSVSTVKVHLHNLQQKLGLPGRTDVVVFAVREGLV